MSEKDEILRPEAIILHKTTMGAVDICAGADPYIWKQNNEWHLLVQGDVSMDPLAHDGIAGYRVRSASRIEDLATAPAQPLSAPDQPANLKQVWAAEVHFEKYLYVAISNGDNTTHRMHVYETEGDVTGPWRYRGPLDAPATDDRWAIDLTLASITHHGEEKVYAVWSGWHEPVTAESTELALSNVIPQSLYIAELISPTKIGPRHLLLEPDAEWCRSVAPILEGPQALSLGGHFMGILVTGNASWTDQYATSVLVYEAGDPLSSDSWSLHHEPLFPAGNGVGHGMIVEDGPTLYYVGHRKSTRRPGWEDRQVFYTKIERPLLKSYLHSAAPAAAAERINKAFTDA